MKILKAYLIVLCVIALWGCENQPQAVRIVENFGAGWTFHLGDIEQAKEADFDDASWRKLDVPHDWAIEGEFSADNPAGAGGGALPGGIGWYRKTFTVPEISQGKLFFIDFDGVYMNSDVWINGQHLGHRPYGYASFRYELTDFLNYGDKENVIAVRVDNELQPNSRWYSGCGIYRNVWLVETHSIHIDHWGTFITTPNVSSNAADISVQIKVKNQSGENKSVSVKTTLFDPIGKEVAALSSELEINDLEEINQQFSINTPKLWSDETPQLYTALTQIIDDGKIIDDYETPFGIRYFEFDSDKGFSLNGKPTKIRGVCMHHDLGCLGSAINTRALERQLELLKEMGCNAIRTSHNPPAPELLDLCDRMGFIVMDEAFDMWKMKKTTYDYSLYYDEWHERDLVDFIKRDRNHPSVIMWSIGNEILEQWHDVGAEMAQELAGIVRELDGTRPITSGLNFPEPENSIVKSGAIDLVGFNYHHESFTQFHEKFPSQKFLGAETGSAIATRGSYDMPSDSLRIWPNDWRVLEKYNADFTCSAYDNCRVGWGSTHLATWELIKSHDYMSGMFYWTGWDYLGEPTPYGWPARSSYFGIIDLAGFPKDAFYFYQAEWTDKPVLHLFPHWNWDDGQDIDVWTYTNFDSVELFVNGLSMGVQGRTETDPHVMWRVDYEPGTIKAVGKNADGSLQTMEIQTAGEAAQIRLTADRTEIYADGKDLSFVTVDILDPDGTLVPFADNLVNFKLTGPGKIVGVDNGHQISHEPFKADYRKAFHGKCLVVIQSTGAGVIELTAQSDGLESRAVSISAK